MLKTIRYLPKVCDYLNQFTSIPRRYAGHSKWANIRHVKGLKDAERANLFMKLSRQMKVAIQEGGSADPNANSRLDQVIAQCKRANMPMASIQNVLKSAVSDKKQCKSHMLEIKGPGNSFVLCEVFTDSVHHLKQSIATILRKNGSRYCEGIINNFGEKGIIEAEIKADTAMTKDQVLEKGTDDAIEVGAEEVSEVEENILEFICGSTNLKSVTGALEKCGYRIISASVEYIPHKIQTLHEGDMEAYLKLYEKLDNLPEVTRISHNVDE